MKTKWGKHPAFFYSTSFSTKTFVALRPETNVITSAVSNVPELYGYQFRESRRLAQRIVTFSLTSDASTHLRPPRATEKPS